MYESIASDKQAFTLSFGSYIAEMGPGIPLRDSRKNCQITLTLTVPSGWQFSVGTFDYRGFADLPRKTKAVAITQYYFQGQSGTWGVSHTINGPFWDPFQFTDKIPLLSWSPCGEQRALNVNTSIAVRNSGARSRAAWAGTDSVDGYLTQKWGISWRRC